MVTGLSARRRDPSSSDLIRRAGRREASARERLWGGGGPALVGFGEPGHGVPAGRLAEGTVGGGRDGALAVLDQPTAGPQIVVGSGMGAGIMLIGRTPG